MRGLQQGPGGCGEKWGAARIVWAALLSLPSCLGRESCLNTPTVTLVVELQSRGTAEVILGVGELLKRTRWAGSLSFSPSTVEGEFRGVGKKGQACVQLARILQYLECPQ